MIVFSRQGDPLPRLLDRFNLWLLQNGFRHSELVGIRHNRYSGNGLYALQDVEVESSLFRIPISIMFYHDNPRMSSRTLRIRSLLSNVEKDLPHQARFGMEMFKTAVYLLSEKLLTESFWVSVCQLVVFASPLYEVLWLSNSFHSISNFHPTLTPSQTDSIP